MNLDEKLNDVRDNVQHLIDIAKASDRRLAQIEQAITYLQAATKVILDKAAGGWSERP